MNKNVYVRLCVSVYPVKCLPVSLGWLINIGEKL